MGKPGDGVVGSLKFLLVYIDSLEYHSSMIADAVKKVIKVGKVSLERCWFRALVLLSGDPGPQNIFAV